jgi:hypothetical protein
MITLAVGSVFSPRFGGGLAFSRPWSHSILLFPYRSVLWNADVKGSAMTCWSARAGQSRPRRAPRVG